MRRSQRIVAITKALVEQPYRVFQLREFAELFNSAKSTISEDIAIIKETLLELNNGRIETLHGVSGGVRYVPYVSSSELHRRVNNLAKKLSEPKRILPGGFIYLNDLVDSPVSLAEIGEIFAQKFSDKDPEYIVTVETSGIPIALMTARALNLPLVVVSRQSRLTEGPVLTMNYLSGSSRRLETMSLSRRALPPHAKVLIIDDFMKAGGTLRGLVELMDEFECEVVGKGVLIDTAEPKEKLIDGYLSLIRIDEIDEAKQKIVAKPADWIS